MKRFVHRPPLSVPSGFSGWWCQHCEAPRQLSDELGSPARCPICHKPTCVWVPPVIAPAVPSSEFRVPSGRRPRAERSRALFDHIRRAMEDPGINPDYYAYLHEQTVR